MVGEQQLDWTIRPAVPADGLGELPSLASFTLVAVTAGARALGVARVLESDGSFHLLELSVIPSQRRLGIGQALVRAVESAVVDRGASALTLLSPSPDASRFFAELGFYRLPQLPVALRWLAAAAPGSSEHANRPAAMGKSLAPDVVPRPAVSVLPLRDGAGGLEVFAQHRVATMDFAAGAVVFPGGRIDPEDYETTIVAPPGHAQAWAQTDLPAAPILLATAIREVAEECDVWLEPAALLPWDNWITPPGGRRRFDVAFFVTAVSDADSQRWSNTTTEALRSVWEPVAGLLASQASGAVRLMPPTKALLTELAGFKNCADVLTHAPLITPVMDDEPVRPRPPRSAAHDETAD